MPLCVRQAFGKVGEPAGHPGVVGHVGQHARTVDEAGLGGHDQKAPSDSSVIQMKTRAEPRAAQADLVDERLGEHLVHRVGGSLWLMPSNR